MKKAGIAAALAMVMVLVFAYAYAQDPGAGPAPQGVRGHIYEHHGKWLGLDQQQKDALRALQRKFAGETAQLKGELVTAKQELRLMWSDPKADPKAILAKEKKLRDLQDQMRDKIVHYKLEARKLLTPEQIEKLGSMDGRRGLGFGRDFHRHERGQRGFRDRF